MSSLAFVLYVQLHLYPCEVSVDYIPSRFFQFYKTPYHLCISRIRFIFSDTQWWTIKFSRNLLFSFSSVDINIQTMGHLRYRSIPINLYASPITLLLRSLPEKSNCIFCPGSVNTLGLKFPSTVIDFLTSHRNTCMLCMHLICVSHIFPSCITEICCSRPGSFSSRAVQNVELHYLFFQLYGDYTFVTRR